MTYIFPYPELRLKSITSYNGIQFSTGLTKPAIMACNMNNVPITQTDSISFCFSTNSKTATVNVLANDMDIDPNDTVYLTNAVFSDPDDATLADLTVNAADSTITLTVKPSANINTIHTFEIIYDVKDNGLPASQCGMGQLKITIPSVATSDDITANNATICYNTTATLTANAPNVPNPEYKWYATQISTEVLSGIADYTTPNLTATTTYYVSVSGDNYCENATGSRKPVTVTVNPLCAHDDHFTVTCEAPEDIEVLLNDNISDNCKTSLSLNITEHPEHGTAKVEGTGSDAKIVYTYTGVELAIHDSLTYEISCGSNPSSTAKVRFTVSHVGSAFVDDVWYFGENSQGIRFVNNGSGYVAQDASGESKVQSHENSLVVSSPYCDGQNIFYSSHDQIYNSQHQPMQHGHFAGHQSVADGLAACYIGGNQYLFFSVTNAYESATTRGLNAYIVDMSANYGKGDIVNSVVIENLKDFRVFKNKIPLLGVASSLRRVKSKAPALQSSISV
ncbi:MAG: hypothetical protein LBK97_01830 [Prevotellaceae bacterium]|jgi:hypothetical protein|nr:hypothetical protein [Prevotellaceae bacterium]